MNPSQVNIAQKLLTVLQQLLGLVQKPSTATITIPPAPATDPILYTKAVSCLDKHITLNPAVPADVGCAEAVSYVMRLAGVNDGILGIAGTAQLDAWLVSSPLFKKVLAPTPGAILVSPTGSGNGEVEGHTGIVAKFNVQYPNDYGVLSNNSNNGLFMEQWSISAWAKNYHSKGGLPMNYYVLSTTANLTPAT